jgi:sulfur-oxidizing protein SoxY
MKRRLALSLVALPWASAAFAQTTPEQTRALQAALQRFCGSAPLQSGKVQLEIASLVDNGNTVPLTLRVNHPANDPNPLQAVALFCERNPNPEVFEATLNPRHNTTSPISLSTRVRLVTSQPITAVARLANGECWVQRVNVIVTLAACLEPEDGG